MAQFIFLTLAFYILPYRFNRRPACTEQTGASAVCGWHFYRHWWIYGVPSLAVRRTSHEHGLYRDSILPVRSRIRVRYTQRSLLLFCSFGYFVIQYFSSVFYNQGDNIAEILNWNYGLILLYLSLFFLYRLICIYELIVLFQYTISGDREQVFLWYYKDFFEQICSDVQFISPPEGRHWKTVFSYYIQCLKVDWCTLFFVNLYAKRTFSVAFLTIDIHANLITLFSALATFMSLSILLSNVASPFNNSSRLKSYNSLILIMLTISGSDFPVSLN